jgi:hypothetical protein
MIKHFFKSIWIAVRALSLGIGIGALTAPHSGPDTRRIIKERVLELFDRAIPEASAAPVDFTAQAPARKRSSSKAVGSGDKVEL